MRTDRQFLSASAWASVIAIGLIGAPAQAVPIDPYTPSAVEIQGMLDRTSDYSGGAQASVAVAANVAGGLQLDVVWSTGTPGVNETFTRLARMQRFPADTGDGDGGDLEAFDGVMWNILSDIDILVKPMTQTFNGFTFYEGTQNLGCGAGTFCVSANVLTPVWIDWDNVTSGGSIPLANRANLFEIGFQIFGPNLPQDGTIAESSMTITTAATAVPEPASLLLLGTGVLALFGVGYRSRRHAPHRSRVYPHH